MVSFLKTGGADPTGDGQESPWLAAQKTPAGARATFSPLSFCQQPGKRGTWAGGGEGGTTSKALDPSSWPPALLAQGPEGSCRQGLGWRQVPKRRGNCRQMKRDRASPSPCPAMASQAGAV